MRNKVLFAGCSYTWGQGLELAYPPNYGKDWEYLNGIIQWKDSKNKYAQLPRTVDISISMNLLEKSPTGCAVLKNNWNALIHHSQVTVSKEILERIRFREENAYAREGASGGNEDALFCGDALALMVFVDLNADFVVLGKINRSCRLMLMLDDVPG